VGLYPEQAANWDWIGDRIRAARRPVKVLNLFAYTGGSTLAAAGAGADEVVHVDAARGVVAWARRNAQLSDLSDRPIRWIVEDARKFVERELRRGNAYQGIILDPPAYGHGPRAQTWKLDQHLNELLRRCGRLTRDQLAFILLTCHDPAWGPAKLAAQLADAVPNCDRTGIDAGSLTIRSRDGRHLPSGTFARWPR
jgi:23S rRNA (cytosine1962-C5)-methyltransferase